MKSRADLVCPDSGKDLYPLGVSFTKPEHDIKSEGASTFRSGEATMKFALLFLAPSCALGGPPPSLDGGSSIQGEDENPSAIGYREALRHRV
jgi:hypothetical protein